MLTQNEIRSLPSLERCLTETIMLFKNNQELRALLHATFPLPLTELVLDYRGGL